MYDIYPDQLSNFLTTSQNVRIAADQANCIFNFLNYWEFLGGCLKNSNSEMWNSPEEWYSISYQKVSRVFSLTSYFHLKYKPTTYVSMQVYWGISDNWGIGIFILTAVLQIYDNQGTVIPVIVTAVTNNLCNKKVQKFGKMRFLFLGGYYF